MKYCPVHHFVQLIVLSVAVVSTARATLHRAPVVEGLGVALEVEALLTERRARLEQAPNDPARWASLGVALHAHSLHDLAEPCYEEALRLAPGDAKWIYWLALVQLEIGRGGDGMSGLQAVVGLKPDYPQVHWRLGHLHLQRGELDLAAAEFLELSQSLVRDAGGYLGLARVALQRRAFAKAAEYASDALRLRPADRYAAGLLGAAYRGLGQGERARPLLVAGVDAVEEFSDPWADEVAGEQVGWTHWLGVATQYFASGRVAEALARLEAALADHPGESRLMNKIAEGYLVEGRAEEAIALLRTARRSDPGNFVTYLHLAQAHRARGATSLALERVEEAIEINPNVWQPHVVRARLLRSLRRHSQSARSFDRALDLGAHQDVEVTLERGELHMLESDWDTAKPIFADAVSKYPFLPRAVAGLAMCQIRLGELDGARETLQGADPNDRRVRIVRLLLASQESELPGSPENDDLP